MSKPTNCPCNPEQPYAACCAPFLEGGAPAPTAEQLMRSRYTAYALQDRDHLLRTWHPSSRPPEKELADQHGIEWTGLEILRTEQGGTEDTVGEVEFVAHCRIAGIARRIHERSRFRKEDGQWLYVDGETMKDPPVRSSKVGRNEPCPCGSGKKFKKCCMP